MIAWGLEKLTPWSGWYQLSAGVALLGLGGFRPLVVLITDGVVPLMQEE